MRKNVLIIMLCYILGACGEKKDENKAADEPLNVVTEKAIMNSTYAQMPYVGVVKEESNTMVSFNGMGILKTLNAREGQTVQKGQLLAVIDDAQAKNALIAAKAALDQALDAEARMRQLHDQNSLPDMKWIEIESKVQQARATYDICKKNVDDCRVYAPVSGVIGSKIMGVGENVLPTEPVLTIMQIGTVKIQVSIPEKEIASINEGTSTNISIEALGGDTFQGGRIEKGVSADAMTHTYNVYIYVPNTDHRLLPGMVASVKFGGEETTPMLTVPVKAVQSGKNGLFVWINDGGKAKRVNVVLGETIGNRSVVCGGELNEGMEVVVEGYQKLNEGRSITPIAGGMS